MTNEIKWFRGKYDRSLNQFCNVSVKGSTVTFNSKTCKKVGVKNERYVRFGFDSKNSKLLFEFTDDYCEGCFLIRKTNSATPYLSYNRVTSCKELIDAIPRLSKAASEKNRRDRVLPVDFCEDTKKFFVKLKPIFDEEVPTINQIEPETKGVYKLLFNTRLLYLGQSRDIRNRIREHKDKGWNFNVIKFFKLGENENPRYWESIYLQEIEKETGSLPPYNQQRNHAANLKLPGFRKEQTNEI